ncbi:MAG: hypothetical protein A2600_00260 [Candidatus Lambdaproteobacteria bacterium RIFOXYD1_FULL_56_27]|uniref:ATP synthase subunit I n=1 Tax=Candidatus Lambdaproteobacteria bacterium RIFOXYD2_FULL_56_26 TaxID=1817773 RepID=A0A1F6GPQ4_9PROT|nr:MAG: hypothetical protein A2557_04380 [Candidatus Lambdaproteobacteria bacterium RIFOXYD2_FULL_56_26]OGH03950.1 MAG: hypothetical protein A2426_07605 [Candidatus Lambdaproteobacteria bacterium RIFOXYC1_FULL_56_13]OGH06207.1 MAG: hypothetical protein A2600_00260 [Candidatus Lambdaproteobacteria bacterium RIFOXYD1_FULL_56_27]
MDPTPKTTEKNHTLRTLNRGLLGLFFLVTALGGLAFGLDFAKGALVGCIVVAINFYLSQFLMARLFFSGHAKAPVLVMYLLKFGLSMGLLWIAMTHFNADLWGIMAGLSTLFVISLWASFLGKTAPEPEQTESHSS